MRRRSALLIFGLLIFLVFSGVLDYMKDMLFYPWARATPPLLDHWVGELTTGNGIRLGVAMDMQRDYMDDGTVCTRCSQIEGTAVTCDGRGTRLRYRISGSPRDRRGRTLHIGASPDVSPAPDGLELSTVSGQWDQGDVLLLEADFSWRRGISASSSTDDPATQPVPLRMERKPASAFESLCRALR
jgi:hypothetical protein